MTIPSCSFTAHIHLRSKIPSRIWGLQQDPPLALLFFTVNKTRLSACLHESCAQLSDCFSVSLWDSLPFVDASCTLGPKLCPVLHIRSQKHRARGNHFPQTAIHPFANAAQCAVKLSSPQKLMYHVQLVAHKDTQVLFHKTTLHPVSAQPVLAGLVPDAGPHDLHLLNFMRLLLGHSCSLLSFLWGFFSSFVHYHTTDFTIFSVICRAGKHSMHLITKVTQEDVKTALASLSVLGECHNQSSVYITVKDWSLQFEPDSWWFF